MDRPRSNRIKRFCYSLLLLAIPIIFIASVNTLTAKANVNSAQSVSGLPTVGFTLSNYSVDEDDGTVAINVAINPVSDRIDDCNR